MQPIEQALEEIRSAHERLTGVPAPPIGPESFVAFPPGVDPVAHALEEVAWIKQTLESAKPHTPETQPAPSDQPASWIPAASFFAGPAGLMMRVELPGVTKDDISVFVRDSQLTVQGQRSQPAAGQGLEPVFIEQAWGAFERRFVVPAWCRSDDCTARYADGVLEITLRRGEEQQSADGQIAID